MTIWTEIVAKYCCLQYFIYIHLTFKALFFLSKCHKLLYSNRYLSNIKKKLNSYTY